MLDKESNLQPDTRLLRLWNSQILPGYAVVAVDEREPEYPEGVVVERGAVRDYGRDLSPLQTKSLFDEWHFRRRYRLGLEGIVRRYNRDNGSAYDVREVVQFYVHRKPDSFYEPGYNQVWHIYGYLMVLKDYDENSKAYIDWMN